MPILAGLVEERWAISSSTRLKKPKVPMAPGMWSVLRHTSTTCSAPHGVADLPLGGAALPSNIDRLTDARDAADQLELGGFSMSTKLIAIRVRIPTCWRRPAPGARRAGEGDHGLRVDDPDGLALTRAGDLRPAGRPPNGGAGRRWRRSWPDGEEIRRLARRGMVNDVNLVGWLFTDPLGKPPQTRNMFVFTGGNSIVAEVERNASATSP